MMGSLSAFLKSIGSLLAHIVGDPVHAAAGTALQTVLQVGAQAVETGATEVIDSLAGKMGEIIGTPGATTPTQWQDLHQTAKDHAADMASAPKAAPPPTAPPTGSSAPPVS